MTSVVRPFARTGRYYARSRRDYREHTATELPVARPTLRLAAQALRDEIVLVGLQLSRPVSEGATFERITREVTAALAFYGQNGWLANPRAYFARPTPLTTLTTHEVKRRGRTYQRFTFDSGYAPYQGEPGRDRWLSYTATRREYGLILRHPEPRPWLVCVHGTEMGRAGVDLRLFRAWHLHQDLGLNVVLPVLPLHGPRKRGVPKGAVLPGEDALDNVHAAAQAVWDIRRVLSWIRAQEPGSPIGLNGMSLGGYIAALVASLEDGLTCAILGVPVADLVEILARHSGLARDDPRRETILKARPIGRMMSPLSLTPRVPIEGRFIYGGVADRVVHPRDQVIRLWEHWGRPEIVWYPGGHTGFFRSRPVQDFIDTALMRSGLVP
ncbi:MAG: hypothetical protein JO280_03890 [Mycobacteriaceae bacterium]|nr:hypothetical protein [Mycobacteriaceae bacterium]